MARIIGFNQTHITSGVLGNKRTPSCSGVPGDGTLPSAYIYVNLNLALAVDENGALYARPASGVVEQTGMTDSSGADWDAFFIARTSSFSLTFNPGEDLWTSVSNMGFFYRSDWMTGQVGESNLHGKSEYGAVSQPATDTDAVNAGFGKLPYTIGQIQTEVSESGGVRHTTGKLWVSIPVLYNDRPNSAITISSVEFTVSMDELLAYYPFAIRKSGQMKSANRSGGSVKIRKSGAWRDVKNIGDDAQPQNAYVRKSNSWVRAPEIGAQ